MNHKQILLDQAKRELEKRRANWMRPQSQKQSGKEETVKESKQQNSYTLIEVDRKSIYSAPNSTASYSQPISNTYFNPLEINTNTDEDDDSNEPFKCPVCHTMMSTAQHDPFISNTCCHSICKMCVFEAMNNEEMFCPLCNSRVESFGINDTLKKMIKEKLERDKHLPSKIQYQEQYTNYQIRISAIQSEIQNLKQELNNDKSQFHAYHSILDQMRQKEQQIIETIEDLKKKLETLQTQMSATEKESESCHDEINGKEKRLKILEDTVKQLEASMEKCEIFLNK